MIRFAARFLILVVLLAAATAAGFRGWAALRESQSPVEAAGSGALYARVGDLQIHYRQWGPADGPPLLLVPGTLAWSETFRDIAAPLGDRGFRVVALDLPPFGYSERPADHDYSRRAQGRLILGFADALGLGTFALGVHSYGGGAALEAAFSAPRRIGSVVLLDVALGLGQPQAGPPLASLLGVGILRDAIVAATFTNPYAVPFGLRDFIHDDAIVTPERTEIYTRLLTVAATTEAVGHWLLTGLYADEAASLAASEASYRAFDHPVLIVWGRQDTVTPLGQGEALAALLPDAELAVLDGVNHLPHVEKPDEVVRLIGSFLRAHAGKGDRLTIDAEMRGTFAGG